MIYFEASICDYRRLCRLVGQTVLLIICLVFLASCNLLPEGDPGFGVGVVPFASFGRSELNSDFSSRSNGAIFVQFGRDEVPPDDEIGGEAVSDAYRLEYLPLELETTGEEGYAVIVDYGLKQYVMLCSTRNTFWTYSLGVGGTLAFNHLSSEPDFFGVGVYGEAAFHWHFYECLRLGIFGKARGWFGGSGNGFETAGSLSAGLVLALTFF